MPNHRYHIHVICVAHDQPMVLDGLAVFFQNIAFLTYDIATSSTQASVYSRQCIDDCDCTIVVIGDSYGSAEKNSVSQLHLSYLSARTKIKPMLVLIKSLGKSKKASRQLRDFTRLVEQQVYDVYYYDDKTDIPKLLIDVHTKMVKKHNLVASWTRMQKSSNADKAQKLSGLSSEKNTAANNIDQPFKLSELVEIRYSAQAYEDGNLSDIKMTIKLSWQQILQAIALISATFSSYSLQVCINRLIASHAEKDIKQQMPNVHAVSRYQVFHSDLNHLQQFLVPANCIQLTASSLKTSQELWRLTFYAKKLLESSQIKNVPVLSK